MSNYLCTHRQYNPSTVKLEPVTTEQYQDRRSKPDKPAKDRSNTYPTRVTIKQLSSQAAQDKNMRRFLLNEVERVKVIGYGRDAHPATTGTSKINRLCVTDGMGPCIAVAIAGEKKNSQTGYLEKGAKVRVFHIYPHNDKFADDISSYVKKLANDGLTVKAAMHGGDEWDLRLAKKLRDLFEKTLDVPLEFDETCEKRGDINTPLGVVIGDDHAVRFVTEVAAVVEK